MDLKRRVYRLREIVGFSLVSPEIGHYERAYRGYRRRLSSLSLWRSETVEFATSKLNIRYVQISWVAIYFSFGLWVLKLDAKVTQY